ncbi:dipeptidyl aminopeptidase/acylaminoacyl peptidase [Lipingzhangella halophila]|uniref:Dipeptidyl aminopeptidase/acylaminoacyl peptidase n=1 Tax=Lipingzhangella halophila TaxID=1783352 RepID=A0A7W7RMJ9_9ACTN|nr:S9 family peptidase [Lipingzhangella halophila]MBB4934343.1 dipeptidyl aminopeptidase/acylaminoacyl peptidase [Lipingzhangella halophila]
MTSTQQRPRRFEAEELFADPDFSRPIISPDGTRIAYLAPAHGRRNIWVRGIDEEHEDARCVTHDARRGISTYFFSDDPRWLLYLQDTDGNEDWHLFRVDLDAPDSPATDLTPMAPGSRVFAAEPLGSRPGTVIATMNRRPASLDSFLIDVASGGITLHHEQPGPGVNLLLDRDGEPAFLSRVTEDGDTEFSAIDPVTGEQRMLTRLAGPDHPMGVEVQQATPDGTGLVLGSYLEGDDLQLVRVDRESGKVSVLAAVEGRSLDIMGTVAPSVLPPTLFTHGQTGSILAARFNGPRPHIEVVDPRFAEVHAALSVLSDGVLGSLSSDAAGQRWIATFVHDRAPDAWFYDHATGNSRRLFRPSPHLDPADLAPMEPVELAARDGLPLHGFLTLPVGLPPRDLPLVLVVHGGPWVHDTWGYSPQAQFLANRGYAVLQVNYRGSSGYGRCHTVKGLGEFAGAMHDDLIDAVDWAIAQGIAAPERIGIMGASYGGYAALVGAAFTPDRFAAAVDIVGIADLASFIRALPPVSRPYITSNWLAYVGDPDDPAQEKEMLARSPITHVDRMTTPLLIAHGANDARVMRTESDAIVASLRERDISVEYLLADDEGHGFGNPENEIRLQHAIEKHFAAHLG